MVSRMRRPAGGILLADSLLDSWRMRIVRALVDQPLQIANERRAIGRGRSTPGSTLWPSRRSIWTARTSRYSNHYCAGQGTEQQMTGTVGG